MSRAVPRVEVDEYIAKHWGEEPDFVYEDPDPRLRPAVLHEMGKLQEIDVRVLDAGGRRIGSIHLDFPDDDRCILAYDRKTHRLYCVYPSNLTPTARGLWQARTPAMPLARVARALGNARSRPGRHERAGCAPYPRVDVQPVGPVDHVVYWTHKRGHGPSRYKHTLGENSGIRPDLCVSADGRLWWAGGNYTVEKHGIID